MIGPQAKRLPVVSDRLVDVVGQLECMGQVVPGVEVAGLELQGSPIVGDGGGGLLLGQVGVAQVVVGAGVFRIEVLSGTIELETFRATTIIGGQFYEQTYAIPEPNSVALLLLGSGIFYLRRKTFSNQRVHSIAGSARSE